MSLFTNRIGDARREAGRYTEAVLGLLGNQDPLAVLGATPDTLARTLRGCSDADAARAEAPGKWSILQVVRHLVDSDLVWAYRLRRIAAEDRPDIQGYDQDVWAENLRYAGDSLGEAMGEWRALRALNLRFIASLSTAQMKRVGVHSERGEESIEHLIRMYAEHDVLHVRQIDRIMNATRAPGAGGVS